MKKINLLIVFLVSFTQSREPYVRTFYDQEKVYGNVKSINEIQITPKSDGTMDDSLILKTIYDKAGNVTEEAATQIYHKSPNVDAFDGNGNIDKKERTIATGITKYITHHNNNGTKNMTSRNYGQDEIYLFNKMGLLISVKTYQLKKELIGKDLYKYDDRDRLTELNGYNNKDSLYNQSTYQYNDKDLLIEERTYYPARQPESIYNYSYFDFDKRGNWIKREIITRDIKYNNTIKRNVSRKITYY